MAVYSFGLCSQGLESSMQDSTVSGKAAKLIAAHPHATQIKHESHVTDEDLWRPISCTLYKHAPGNTHTYIYPRQTHGVQHVYWCYCMPLQSCLNTYTIAPSTEMDTCPAPAFATGEPMMTSVFDYGKKQPHKVRTELRRATPQLAPSVQRVTRMTTHEVTTERTDDDTQCALMNKLVY